MTSSRGLLRLPAGLYATARSIGQKRSRTELVSGALRLSLTPDGGFASIGGSGARLFAALFERLFDIVIRRKGNADGGVLASRLLRSRRRDSDVVCVFIMPIGVLRADPLRICVAPRLLGTRQNAATPWKIPPRDSESNSQPKSLILAQNERWRQA